MLMVLTKTEDVRHVCIMKSKHIEAVWCARLFIECMTEPGRFDAGYRSLMSEVQGS